MNDSTYLSVKPGKTRYTAAKKEDIGKNLWQLAQPLNNDNIFDGLGVWRGYISGFAEVSKEFGSEDKHAIVGTGGEGHLNVIVGEQPSSPEQRQTRGGLFLELTSEAQIRGLLGSLYNPNELMSEEGLDTLRNTLNNTPVIVFGSGLTPKGLAQRNRGNVKYQMKQSKVKLANGLGMVVPFPED